MRIGTVLWVKGALSLCCLALGAGVSAAEFSMTEVARHNTATSCWMVIEGRVYDVTPYLPEHRDVEDYDLLKWCGTEATRGWRTKDDVGEPHRRKSARLLEKYFIGVLVGR